MFLCNNQCELWRLLIKLLHVLFACGTFKNFIQTHRCIPFMVLNVFNSHNSLFATVIIGGSRGGREGRTPPPWASKFFRFHAVFGKIWRVHAPPGGFTPPLGKILDPPLVIHLNTLLKICCILSATVFSDN